ncbi:cell envelope integrity protein CreD [Chitinimonas koreensis]|uniref:cell envelope integrity protein CreD n=1 Tax=Chitinimonas koreensis TaxID=356302 RepID=UPI00040CDFB7|nr:cell envelope integrity protein CreD [Chitinimonas koreensis]QNM97015.1 cell envelope integrity protein CreD [Chitinimonas koreensis]
MFKSLMWKLVAIGVLALLLLIPLAMVDGLVGERQNYRRQAIASIADGVAGSQTLAGPVWVLPYKRRYLERTEQGGELREVWRDEQVRLLPDKLAVGGKLSTQTRQRGIYRTQVYRADLTVGGSFVLPARAGLPADADVRWGQPYLSVGIADVRGIKQSPRTSWGAQTAAFEPGARLKPLGDGIHAPLPAYDGQAASVPFSFELALEGMDGFGLIPLGRDSEVGLRSDWQHPSFDGRFLPDRRQVDAKGFVAGWRTSWFSTNLNELFGRCQAGECDGFRAAALGVRLIEPVDVYLQTDRAVKYGFLFVFLTFCAFFLTEVLKRVAIHPVQYGLVGLSLAVFFLLLLSFAEQWAFAPAYALAAGACVLQNGIYAGHALGGHWRGLGFAALLAALYGLLYLLLRSEDHALLLGSLLLFGVLTAVMMLTRKLDWYAVARPQAEERA